MTSSGDDMLVVAEQSRGIVALLRHARKSPKLASELQARLFLRVLFSELFIDGANGFEAASKSEFFEPLLVMLGRVAADPKYGDNAEAVRRSLRGFSPFGGPVSPTESFPEWNARVASDLTGFGLEAQKAVIALLQEDSKAASAKTPATVDWLDSFRPENFKSRPRRIRPVKGADPALVARLDQTYDLGLLIADALKDVVYQTHWVEQGLAGSGPRYATLEGWTRLKAPEGSLERKFERSVVVSISKRLSEPMFVQRIRTIIGELRESLPAQMIFPATRDRP